MRIARPWSLELNYTKEMMASLLLGRKPLSQKVLLIGLGAAFDQISISQLPTGKATVVEIEPAVIALHVVFQTAGRPEKIKIVIGRW